MAGKGGGAWKVAYADFVTAMMAFFLVMWLVAQSKPIKEAVAKYFNDPLMSSKGSGSSASFLGSGQGDLALGRKAGEGSRSAGFGFSSGGRTKDDGAKAPQHQKTAFSVLHDGDHQAAGTVVVFEELSAELDPEAEAQLKRLLPFLNGKRNKIELRGHATGRPLPPDSPYKDAWQLCYARCQAVLSYYRKQGIEPERFRLSQAGVFEPHTIRVQAEKQAQNSRVEVYVLAELVEDLMGTREERAERFRTPGLSAEKGPKVHAADKSEKPAAKHAAPSDEPPAKKHGGH